MGSNTVTMAAGEVIAGRYRVEALLGQGGCGVVYRATQVSVGRTVALKMLRQGSLVHADGRARFRREAELAQRLSHPNTVRLHDFGETESGLPFIAWELLEGRPLDAVLAAEGRLAPGRVIRIASQTLKSLMEAHALGVVHRDIKPSNVFLCELSGERDYVKVLDFGIAKSTLATAGAGLTPEGSVLGTPAYMAPEQVQGLSLSPRSDLYSLGLVMAEMLAGRVVYGGRAPLEVIMAQLDDKPVPLPPDVVSSPLGPVIARAVEKAPDRRFASAAEMLAALEAVEPLRDAAPSTQPATVVTVSRTTDPSAVTAAFTAPDLAGPGADTALTTAFAATGQVPIPPPTPAPSAPDELPTLAMPAVPLPEKLEVPRVSRRRLALAAAAGVLAIGASVTAVVLVQCDTPAPPRHAHPPRGRK